jgi:hypothetical protein
MNAFLGAVFVFGGKGDKQCHELGINGVIHTGSEHIIKTACFENQNLDKQNKVG